MKKILLAMCVLALSSGMAFAACDGGEMITIGEKAFVQAMFKGIGGLCKHGVKRME